jgi:uncharacterized protein (DUF885 family)
MTVSAEAHRRRAYYDHTFAALLSASPEVAAELGLVEVAGRRIPQDRFSDLSEAGEAQRRELMAQTLQGLRALAPSSPQERLDREIYEFFLRWGNLGHLRGTEAAAFGACDYVADHLAGVQAEIVACLGGWQPLEDERDVEAWMSRLHAIPPHIDALIEALRRRVARGNVMPAPIVRRVVAEIEALLASPVARHPLLRRYEEARGVGSAAHVGAGLLRGFYPAYQRLRDFLKDHYPGEDRLGLWRMEQGEAWYAFLLKAHTTTNLSADEILRLGQQELARLQSELAPRMQQAGFAGGSLRERFAAFDGDPRVQLAPASSADLMTWIEELLRTTEAQIMPLFGTRPRARVIVRPVPAAQEANRHSAYVPAATDGSRPGVFEVNLAQAAQGARPDLYTLVYHEAMPGHHVQISIAQERDAQAPAFRRCLVHDGFIEGWAKYAELLPGMEGVNTDPLWDIARRRSELYSTANLVLDTSIHTRRWTRDEAIRFFSENTGCEPGFAGLIVDRVTARPAQACAYKIGMLSITNARRRMRDALGARFDIRRFHDLVLGQGSMPLALFERHVDPLIGEPASPV